MCDPVLSDLLEKFSKTGVSSQPSGVSFRGQGLKLDTQDDAKVVVKAIRDTPDLTYLDLEGNTLGVEAAKAVGEALRDRSHLKRALWKDMFTGRMKTEIPIALKHLAEGLTAAGAQLIELDLSDNAFGPIGVEALADLLKSPVCYQLQELRLNNNGLGITGGKILASALLAGHANSVKAGQQLALKVFIAGRNRLENDGATALSQVFKTMKSLEEICMPQNGIYHVGISKLSEAFEHNVNLRHLNLNDNTLTKKGVASLAIALPALQKLQILNLGDCLLKTKGALILAEALEPAHQQLEELLLESNEIRIDGGLAIVRALRNKKQIKKLNLTGNEFGEIGRESLKKQASVLGIEDTIECPSDEDADASDGEDESGDETSESDDEETDDDESSDEKDSIVPGPNKSDEKIDTTILQFLLEPTQENFKKLADKDVNAIVDSFRIPGDMMDVETCVKLIMKLSNLSSTKNESIRSSSEELSVTLYKALFNWAEKAEQLSEVNNILFVYLQLIKPEDDMKISWDVDRCVNVLQTAIRKQMVPNFTVQILNCCLDRKGIKHRNSMTPQQIVL